MTDKVRDADDLLTPSPSPSEADEGKSLDDVQEEAEGQATESLDQKHTDTTGTA